MSQLLQLLRVSNKALCFQYRFSNAYLRRSRINPYCDVAVGSSSGYRFFGSALIGASGVITSRSRLNAASSKPASRTASADKRRRQSSTVPAIELNNTLDESFTSIVPQRAIKPRASTPYYGPKAKIKATTTAKSIDPTTSNTTTPMISNNVEESIVSGALANHTTTSSSSVREASTTASSLLDPFDLLTPDAFTGERRIPYPKALSPSSIKEFQACPQSFLFQYILGLRQPANMALAKGSMCHAALERVFDLDPADRSLTVLQNLFRTAWAEHRLNDIYRPLFEEAKLGSVEATDPPSNASTFAKRDLNKEASWGKEGLQLLENYWKVENAAKIARPNPVQREVWVKAKLTLDASLGVTASKTTGNNETPCGLNASTAMDVGEADNRTSDDGKTNTNDNDRFLVRGIVDRLDMVQDETDKSAVTLRLIDYKTGKAPDLKYSASMNSKIQSEAFEQLLIYSLLLRESGASKDNPMPLRYLRLFYLTSAPNPQEAVFWDYDMGETQKERDLLLQSVHASLATVWTDICRTIDMQDMRAFTGCTRSFCYCHKCRSRFAPGTVWEPETTTTIPDMVDWMEPGCRIM